MGKARLSQVLSMCRNAPSNWVAIPFHVLNINPVPRPNGADYPSKKDFPLVIWVIGALQEDPIHAREQIKLLLVWTTQFLIFFMVK